MRKPQGKARAFKLIALNLPLDLLREIDAYAGATTEQDERVCRTRALRQLLRLGLNAAADRVP